MVKYCHAEKNVFVWSSQLIVVESRSWSEAVSYIVWELSGEGSVAVAVGVSDI